MSLTLALAALCFAGLGRQTCGAACGYVNVELVAGYNFLANPLANLNDNINTVLPSAPEGSKAFLWDVPAQIFRLASTYHTNAGWDVSVDLPVGRGFALHAPAPSTVTFVGCVLQGSLINFVAGSNKVSLLGSMVPQAASLTAVLAFPEIDGANVHLFNSASQSHGEACTCFRNYGWFDPTGVSGTGGPRIEVAQAFFVQNPGPDTNWIRDFVVQPSADFNKASQPPSIQRIQVKASAVTLEISNPSGGVWNVQFSTDGVRWTTVATNVTGTVWTGPSPGGRAGYYEVAQP